MWKDEQKGLGTGRVERDLPGPPGYSSKNYLVPLEQNDLGYFHSNYGVCASRHSPGAWYEHRFYGLASDLFRGANVQAILTHIQVREHPRGALVLRDILSDL